MKIKLYVLFVTSCWFLSASRILAQSSFISKNAVDSVGVKLVEGTRLENAQFVKLKSNDNVRTYTPHDLDEYGFKNGKTYKSFDLIIDGTSKRYFFERISLGKLNLYYLKSGGNAPQFYLTQKEESALITIPEAKKEHVQLLESLMKDCPQTTNEIRYVKLQRNSMIRLFRAYENCSSRSLPRLRVGVVYGITGHSFFPKQQEGTLSVPDYKVSLGMLGGAFIDAPIRATNFSLHPEAYVRQARSTVAFQTSDMDYDLVTNYAAVNFPVLIRYNFYKFKHVPYLEGGAIYARILKSKIILQEYKSMGKDIFLDYREVPALSNHQVGFAMGGGVNFAYGSKYSWASGIRYNVLQNLTHKQEVLNVNELVFTVGFLF